MNHKILIVEDEARLRAILCDYLLSRGDTPIPAADGLAALNRVEEEPQLDLVLLDIMMPELDGLSVCRAIRRKSSIPVIFLTALSDEDDKLLGYELGADDYVTKPFSLSVLYAKMEALIRRSRGSVVQGGLLSVGPITVKLSAHTVWAGNQLVKLTPKEYALLLTLMQNKNIVLSREQLLVKCWGYDYDGDARAVDTHIRRLRTKLGDCAVCLRTVVKAGYVMEG